MQMFNTKLKKKIQKVFARSEKYCWRMLKILINRISFIRHQIVTDN